MTQDTQGPDPGARFLHVDGITKAFGAVTALQPLDLDVRPGEFITLLGPSGCGKTTLLRILGGLECPDAGRLEFRGADITALPPERRPFNMVFQNYALFPHLDVAANIGFAPRAAGRTDNDVARTVAKMLDLVALEPFAHRSIDQLSGGQRQRVALARALAGAPDVLLLDEPLGALDLQLRTRLQEELRSLQLELGMTFVYVTHDQGEALSMSDRIAVFDHGRICQLGTPEGIYDQPRSRHVAEFVGGANVLAGRLLDRREGRAALELTDSSRPIDLRCPEPPPAGTDAQPYAILRPNHLRIVPLGDGDLGGTVTHVAFHGSYVRYRIGLAGGPDIHVEAPPSAPRHGIGAAIDVVVEDDLGSVVFE